VSYLGAILVLNEFLLLELNNNPVTQQNMGRSPGIRIASEHQGIVKQAYSRLGYASQQVFAELLGISRETVRDFLNGKSISPENFQKICQKLNLDWQEAANLKKQAFSSYTDRTKPPEPVTLFGRVEELATFDSPSHNSFGIPDVVLSDMPSPFHQKHWWDWLVHLYLVEISKMLRHSGGFDRLSLTQRHERTEQNPSFIRIAGTTALNSQVETSLWGSQRLGLIHQNVLLEERLGRKLIFAVSPAHAAPLAIFIHMVRHNCPLRITYNYLHSVEILKYAMSGTFPEEVDGFTLTLSTAAHLLSGTGESPEYIPHMVLPNMSHGIVENISTARDVTTLNRGDFLLMVDPPSSELFIFEELSRAGKINEKASSTVEMEPDSVTRTLANEMGGAKAIIGFPHYHIQSQFNGCKIMNDPYSTESEIAIVLFLHRDIISHTELVQAISLLVRDSWLSLCEQPSALRLIVRQLLSDAKYVKVITRATGIIHTKFHLSCDDFTF
jgi:transcriptional regulator with XRE-family HTH domain